MDPNAYVGTSLEGLLEEIDPVVYIGMCRTCRRLRFVGQLDGADPVCGPDFDLNVLCAGKVVTIKGFKQDALMGAYKVGGHGAVETMVGAVNGRLP